jgi:hypothetical protein
MIVKYLLSAKERLFGNINFAPPESWNKDIISENKHGSVHLS